MNSEFHISIYYIGLLIATIFLSRFLFIYYIKYAKKYNLIKSANSGLVHKENVFTAGGVVYAAVIMVAALVLDNLDFVEFSNFSPILATAILIAVFGFYTDFLNVSIFSKCILLTFLILMLLYSNATLPIIQNLNGFLGVYEIGFIPGLIVTSLVYLLIMNTINLTNNIEDYLAVFSIFFFTSLLYNFQVNKFYTLNSISVIIIGCSLMFLSYNFYNIKKLRLGYAGSLFIGFWISTFLITYITSAPSSKLVDLYSIQLQNIPIIAISMISIPVLDILRLIFVRVINKKSLFAADRDNLHHILLNNGMPNLRTSLLLTFINWFNCIIIFLIEQNFNSKQLMFVYIFISFFWLLFFEYMKRRNAMISAS